MGDRENYMVTKTGKVVEEERMVDGETDKITKTEKVDEEREGWETGRMRRVTKRGRLLRKGRTSDWKRWS